MSNITYNQYIYDDELCVPMLVFRHLGIIMIAFCKFIITMHYIFSF